MTSIPNLSKTRKPSLHPIPQRVLDTVFDKIARGESDECWPWLLSLGSHGYGQIGWRSPPDRAGTTAHRVAWIAVNGRIPPGMTVDHICRNRPCCNPRLLRLLSNVVNARDNGMGRKTYCPSGHPYEGDNLFMISGSRRCRTCAKETARRNYLKRKAA